MEQPQETAGGAEEPVRLQEDESRSEEDDGPEPPPADRPHTAAPRPTERERETETHLIGLFMLMMCHGWSLVAYMTSHLLQFLADAGLFLQLVLHHLLLFAGQLDLLFDAFLLLDLLNDKHKERLN